jgi:hypothetical protein
MAAFADHHAARTCVFTPEIDTTGQSSQLPEVEAAWILGSQLIEQLRSIQVWTTFEPSFDQRPDQCKSMYSPDVSSGQVLSLNFAAPFDFNIQLRRRRSNDGGDCCFASL